MHSCCVCSHTQFLMVSSTFAHKMSHTWKRWWGLSKKCINFWGFCFKRSLGKRQKNPFLWKENIDFYWIRDIPNESCGISPFMGDMWGGFLSSLSAYLAFETDGSSSSGYTHAFHSTVLSFQRFLQIKQPSMCGYILIPCHLKRCAATIAKSQFCIPSAV